MNRIKSKIESLLFISHKPLSVQKIADLIKEDKEEVKINLEELSAAYQQEKRGNIIVKIGQSYQIVTAPENSKIIREFLKEEQTGELTKPALETLTIIAYRSPIAKSELDMIRGVNCSLIIRNLMIKGLVEAVEDKAKMQTLYSITFDFIRHLGIAKLDDLPDYQPLNQNVNLEKLLHPELANQEKSELLQGELNKQAESVQSAEASKPTKETNQSNEEPISHDLENPA